jgi:hypothetical protein
MEIDATGPARVEATWDAIVIGYGIGGLSAAGLLAAVVLLPRVWRSGLATYRPRNVGGQFLRGAFHTLGLMRV